MLATYATALGHCTSTNVFFFFSILLFCDKVTMNFSGQSGPVFQGDKNGRLYLTTHRMIFNNGKKGDPMQSFSFPFVALKDVSTIP